jgi:tRNA(fMet)-specific endonuclease VapC
MPYLFDTDICIHILRKRSPAVIDRFGSLQPGDAAMSVITYLELMHGAWKTSQPVNVSAVEGLAEVISVHPLAPDVAEHYARLRSELERAGTLIGPLDMLIAAHALSLNLTLVIGNVREFNRVKGLRVENWTK